MITSLKLLWRFRWQAIVVVLLLTVLGQYLFQRKPDRSASRSFPNVVDHLRVEQVHPTGPEGDKLPQSILECIDLVYYSEGAQGRQPHQESRDILEVGKDHLGTDSISGSGDILDRHQVELLHELYPDRPLLERTKIEVDDIILEADTRLDRPTGKVDTNVTELSRRKVWFPHDVLLGPQISIDNVGEKIGLNLEYRPGRIGKVHLQCSGELFQYQSIDNSLPEDLIEHFDGVSYEVSCAALYKIH